MTNLNKLNIRKNFSGAAERYEGNCRLQRRIALELLSRAEKHLQKSSGKILDIGCGTGLLAQAITENLQQNLVQIDLAQPMCKAAQNHASALVADAENLPFAAASFANIISSLTIQWLPNFENFAAEMHRVLQPDGRFFISTFGNGTLDELQKSFAFLDAEQHILQFPSTILLFAQLKKAGFVGIEIVAQKIVYHHDNVREILQQMKDIGASYALPSSKKGLRGKRYFTQLENVYRSKFVAENAKLPATWNALYISGRRV